MAVTYTPALRRPFKCPMEPIYRALDDADFCQLRFPKSLGMKNLVFPNRVGALLRWGKWVALGGHTPWGASYGANVPENGIGQVHINSGTTAYFRPSENYAWFESADLGGRSNVEWALDIANNKYSHSFYLDNDLEESDATLTDGNSGSGELCLYDDTEAYWTVGANTTLSEEAVIVKKGTSSLKVEVAGGNGSFCHDYGLGTELDCSAYEFICFYMYGTNSGHIYILSIYTAPVWGNSYDKQITDNFVGWKRFVIPIKSMTVTGVPDMSVVRKIEWASLDDGDTIYFDRFVLDVGQWVKVEAHVPDTLTSEVGIPHAKLYSYTGGAYVFDFSWGNSANAVNQYVTFLNGQNVSDIYGVPGVWDGVAYYYAGLKGEVKAAGGSAAAGDMTYSANYGCKNRIGFGLKMPPDDGLDSSTGGISQAKLKLEVYYGTGANLNGTTVAGMATYEFADSANIHYGLQNMNDSWIALFPSAGSGRVEWLYFDRRPIYLAVRADENKNIDMIKFRLPAGGRAYAGSMPYGLVTRDTDVDGIPDFLEGMANGRVSVPTLCKKFAQERWP